MEKDVRGLFRKFWLHLPFGCFVVAILCLCFTYGVAVGKWHIFPHGLLNIGWDSLKELRKPKRLHFEQPARYEGEGVVVCEREQLYPGVTLLTGHWKDGDDWNLGIRLIDLNGKVLHEWQCNPRDIWAHSPHNDNETGQHDRKRTTSVDGALLLPDGDVIFNLDYFCLARLNAHSEVVWKLPYHTHHSMFQDDDGNIWVCGVKVHRDRVPEFPGLRAPFWEDTILKVTLEGVIEREISVLETICKSEYDGLLRLYTGDILHLNDVEVLSECKADAFNIFQAGDIMVSMHHIHTVLVIDGETERIKWSLTYPFIGQHDPDFTEDGYITVFDNHMNQRIRTSERSGSRIIRIEPSTRKVTTLYGWKENQYFFTAWCGKHQHLPNGNILITEAAAGRVFEITANGEVVWSWIAPRWNKDTVSEILDGTRYSAEFASFIDRLRQG